MLDIFLEKFLADLNYYLFQQVAVREQKIQLKVMKKYKQYWFYLSLASIISLTILVINDINDPANIIAAVPALGHTIHADNIGQLLNDRFNIIRNLCEKVLGLG